MLTREALESKLADFKTNQAQLLANINAVSGAIQLIEQLLQELDGKPGESKEQ